MIRVKVTSNVDAFLKSIDTLSDDVSAIVEAEAKNFLLSVFEIVLENSPADTGSFIQNWHVYKHGGLRGYTPMPLNPPHEREDMAGRQATHAAATVSHMAVLTAELEALNIALFDSEHHQVTIGISNASPYADVLDQGLYNPKPPLINVTPAGYSVQAPNGIVQVSISRAESESTFGQLLRIGGSV